MIFEVSGNISIRHSRGSNEVDLDISANDVVEQVGADLLLPAIGKEKCMEYFNLKEDDE